jgi:hypothetical protein
MEPLFVEIAEDKDDVAMMSLWSTTSSSRAAASSD